jgi:redox-sensitive bicupin YhaK (pirin superfamily)
MYAGLLTGNASATLALNPNRKAYVHVVRGSLHVNGHKLQAGDAAKLSNEQLLTLNAAQDAEVLVFDLAA